MKKLLLITLLITFSVALYPQFSGVKCDITVKSPEEHAKCLDYTEQWICFDYEEMRNIQIMRFKHTPVGYMKMMQEIKSILSKNNLTLEHALINKSLIPSYINDMFDYTNMHNACYLGNGIIYIIWEKGSSILNIEANDETYIIFIKNKSNE
jgi:hypothetical protein